MSTSLLYHGFVLVGYLEKKYGNPNLRQLRRIAIDEIHVGKRDCLAIVLDVLSGAVVFVGDGKGSDALEPFWKKLRRYRKLQIEATAIVIAKRPNWRVDGCDKFTPQKVKLSTIDKSTFRN